MIFSDLTHFNLISKWIFINLHQTPMIFMYMALSILHFKLAYANICVIWVMIWLCGGLCEDEFQIV